MAKEERDKRYLTDSREISGFATRFRALGFKVKLEEDKDRHYPLTLYDVKDRHLLSLGLMVGASQASAGGSARPGESIPQSSIWGNKRSSKVQSFISREFACF